MAYAFALRNLRYDGIMPFISSQLAFFEIDGILKINYTIWGKDGAFDKKLRLKKTTGFAKHGPSLKKTGLFVKDGGFCERQRFL